jgi:hypothetical protein
MQPDTSVICINNSGINNSTLWLFNIAMENGQFIDDFPIETSIYKGLYPKKHHYVTINEALLS